MHLRTTNPLYIYIHIYRYICAGIRYSVVPSMWLPGTIGLQTFSKVFCDRAGVTMAFQSTASRTFMTSKSFHASGAFPQHIRSSSFASHRADGIGSHMLALYTTCHCATLYVHKSGPAGQGHVRRFRVAAVLFKVQPVVFSLQSSPSPAMDPGQHSHGTPQCILVFCPNCCTRLTISPTEIASVGVKALSSSSAVAGTPTGPAPARPTLVLPGTPGGPAPVSPIGGIMVGQESQCSRGRSRSRTISR